MITKHIFRIPIFRNPCGFLIRVDSHLKCWHFPKKFSLLCYALLFLLVQNLSFAQESQQPDLTQTFHIVEIKVEGNKKTKPQVILREMKTKPGQTVTLEQLQLDQQRIASLGLFSRVEMRAEPEEDGLALVIVVSEQWYIFPLPVLFFNDKEIKLKKLTYGAAVVHTNFRGRAEVVQISILLGFNPSFAIDYSNPWIFGDARFFMRTHFFVSRFRNKSSEIRDSKINEERIGGGFTFGKRLTLHTSLSLGLSYRRLRISSTDTTLTLHPSGRDRLPQAIFSFTRDHRDYIFYPIRGSYFRLTLQKTGIPGNAYIDYGRAVLDVRRFFPLGQHTTFGLRYSANLSSGNLPSYDRVFFGF
ncbi:MAG: BamA/TamA family outer membrane protein, partial [bacterium]